MAKRKDKMDYKTASEELKKLMLKLKNEEVSIDELVSEVKRAKELIKYCKDMLRKTEKELDEMED